VPNIDFALSQDQYRPWLRCDILDFFIVSISRQLTVRFRLHLVSSYDHLLLYGSDWSRYSWSHVHCRTPGDACGWFRFTFVPVFYFSNSFSRNSLSLAFFFGSPCSLSFSLGCWFLSEIFCFHFTSGVSQCWCESCVLSFLVFFRSIFSPGSESWHLEPMADTPFPLHSSPGEWRIRIPGYQWIDLRNNLNFHSLVIVGWSGLTLRRFAEIHRDWWTVRLRSEWQHRGSIAVNSQNTFDLIITPR
jgi:hypothetical protein